MKKTLAILSLLCSIGVVSPYAAPMKQQPEEGEKIILEIQQSGSETNPNSLGSTELSAYYYADSEIMLVTCQGFGCAMVSIMSPTLQIMDSDFIDPTITPVACLTTPSVPGQYYLFIVTSSFTANGTFVVE